MTTTTDEFQMRTDGQSGDLYEFKIGGLGAFGTDRRPFLAWKLRTAQNVEMQKGRFYLDQIAVVVAKKLTHRKMENSVVVISEDPIWWVVKFGGNHKSFEATFVVDVNARDWLHKTTDMGAL